MTPLNHFVRFEQLFTPSVPAFFSFFEGKKLHSSQAAVLRHSNNYSSVLDSRALKDSKELQINSRQSSLIICRSLHKYITLRRYSKLYGKHPIRRHLERKTP
jgi:hypothetical protein